MEAKRREPLVQLGTIQEGCTEEVSSDLVLEAEFSSQRREAMVFWDEYQVERPCWVERPIQPSPFPGGNSYI